MHLLVVVVHIQAASPALLSPPGTCQEGLNLAEKSPPACEAPGAGAAGFHRDPSLPFPWVQPPFKAGGCPKSPSKFGGCWIDPFTPGKERGIVGGR